MYIAWTWDPTRPSLTRWPVTRFQFWYTVFIHNQYLYITQNAKFCHTVVVNGNHRLNGSSSPVLTATRHSVIPMGKAKKWTLYKIETAERILTKFGTVDFVLEICPQTKFGDDRSSGGFWVNMWNIRCLWLSLFFPNRPGGHTSQPIFTQNGLNCVDLRIDVTSFMRMRKKKWWKTAVNGFRSSKFLTLITVIRSRGCWIKWLCQNCSQHSEIAVSVCACGLKYGENNETLTCRLTT